MPNNNKTVGFLKRLSFRKIFYPMVSFFAAVIIVFVFFYSVKFIASGIDKIFYEPSENEISGQIVSFDKANYIIVAKKLGISVKEKQTAPIIQQKTSSVVTTTPTITDKKSIKIAIYNSTQTAGLAAKLKSALTGEGYVVAETDTTSPALETTTIKTKEGLIDSDLTEELKEIVSRSYQVVSATLGTASSFDVEIVIGKK